MKRIGFFLVLTFCLTFSLAAQSREQIYQLGRRSFQDQLYSESIEHLRNFMDYYPRDPRMDSALYMVGVSWYNLRNYQSALRVLEQLENEYPESPYGQRIDYWSGLSYYSLREYEEAINSFKNQLEQGEEEYFYQRSLLYLGLTEEKLEHWDQADLWYSRMRDEASQTPMLTQAYFRGGLVNMQQEKYSEALSLFQTLSLEFSSSPLGRDLPFYTAVCYNRMGNLEEANRRYKDYLLLNPRGSLRDKTLLYLAQNAHSAGDLVQAETSLQQILQEYPRGSVSFTAMKNLSSLYVEQERWEEAVALLLSLYQISSGGDKMQAAYTLAEIYLQNGQTDEAAPYLEDLYSHGNADQKRMALLLMAHYEREKGNPPKAMEYYQEYWNRYPEDPQALEAGRWLVSLYREQDRMDEAQGVIDSLLQRFPEDRDRPAFLYMKAEFLQAAGDSSAALERYDSLVQEYPDNNYAAHALYRMGFIYAERGEDIRASQYFRRVLKGNPDDTLRKDAVFSLALSLYRGDSFQEALPVLNQYMENYPDDARGGEIASVLAELYYAEEDYQKAYELYGQSARINTGSEAIRSEYMQAMCLYQQDLWEEGRTLFLQLNQRYPGESWALEGLYMAGVGSRNQVKLEQAEADLKRAVEKSSGELKERAYYMLAQVYLDQDRKTDALALLDEIYQEFPEGILIANLIYRQGDLAYSAGQYEASLEWYSLCLSYYPQHDLAEQSMLRSILCHLELLDHETARKELLRYLDSYPNPLYAAQAARSFSEAVELTGDATIAERFYGQVESRNPSELILAPLYMAVVQSGGFSEEGPRRVEAIYRNENLPPIIRNEALLVLGQYKEDKGEYQDAMDLYKILIATDSGELGAKAQYSLARASIHIDPKTAADEYMNLYYLYPQERELASESLYRAWELYSQLEDQEEKARIVADKLREEYPLSVWTEKLSTSENQG